METWKLKSGFELPKLGLGTWAIGGKRERDCSHDKESVGSIQTAVEMGYAHIDTAEVYGSGHCEELVGQAIRGFSRDNLIIASKVVDYHLRHDDVIAAAKGSLQKIDIEYIDLYYIHAPNPDVPLKETMRAMDALVDEGIVRKIGVSNFTVTLFEEAQSYTKNKIVANQVEYSLLTRESGKYSGNVNMESETLPYCQRNDVLLVAERPLERGIVLQQNAVMDAVAQKYVKSYAQIALNWLVSQKNVVTIPMSQSEAHLKENVGALGWRMESDDIERLRAEYPFIGGR